MRAAPAPETAEIGSLAHDGRGVAQPDGKTVFVHGALPGERVLLRRIRRHRRYDEAEVLEVQEASADRVRPRCAHFGVCGGCALQHLDPARQTEAKAQHVRETLARIGGVEAARWLPPLTGPAWGYRRRARLGARYVHKKGRQLVGFRERASPYLAELARCEVLAPPADGLIAALAALIEGLRIRERVPQVEVAVADNATALVLRVLDEPPAEDLARLRGFERERGVELYLQPGGLDSVRPLTPPATPLRYDLPGLAAGIEFAPTDFVQVNGAVNAAMVRQAVALLEPGPEDRVLDLYCGLGNFSLPLALSAGSVLGVDGEPGLMERARSNAARNGLGHVRFEAADLAAEPPAGAWTAERPTLVLLDPPRAGAREVLGPVAAAHPRRILYVSCHPGTLARDAGLLVREHGYVLAAAGVMDMFPHTAHVESVALFEPA